MEWFGIYHHNKRTRVRVSLAAGSSYFLKWANPKRSELISWTKSIWNTTIYTKNISAFLLLSTILFSRSFGWIISSSVLFGWLLELVKVGLKWRLHYWPAAGFFCGSFLLANEEEILQSLLPTPTGLLRNSTLQLQGSRWFYPNVRILARPPYQP